MARPKNFTLKTVDGLPPGEAGLVARVGDIAVTPGARAARSLTIAAQLLRALPSSPAAQRKFDEAKDQILRAVVDGDARFVSEMAAFVQATSKTATDGPAEPRFALAAAFVSFCQSTDPIPDEICGELSKNRSLKAALPRRPFSPSVREICDHLAVTGCSPLPDYSTVEAWARVLGIKARAKTK